MLFGYGYGYLTLWMSEDVFLNNENSVNISAVYGSQGLLALSPSGLVGKPAVVQLVIMPPTTTLLNDDTAPCPRLVAPGAQAAPTHPRARPEHLRSLP